MPMHPCHNRKPRMPTPAAPLPTPPAPQVLHVLAYAVPTDVRQCVSRGDAEAYPDIQPTLLASDPSTWPAMQAGPVELGDAAGAAAAAAAGLNGPVPGAAAALAQLQQAVQGMLQGQQQQH